MPPDAPDERELCVNARALHCTFEDVDVFIFLPGQCASQPEVCPGNQKIRKREEERKKEERRNRERGKRGKTREKKKGKETKNKMKGKKAKGTYHTDIQHVEILPEHQMPYNICRKERPPLQYIASGPICL
jgi:hypothetical protein